MLSAIRHKAMIDFMERKENRFIGVLSPAEKLFAALDKRGLIGDRGKALEVIESFLGGDATEEDTGYRFHPTDPPDLFIKDWIKFKSAEAIIDRMAGIKMLGAIYVNSRGGSVEQSWQIHEAVKGKAPLGIIHNICASSAVLVILACDKILIDRGASIVLHPAITCVTGNSTAMLGASVALDIETEQIIEAVIKRTGQSPDTVRSWYNKPNADTVLTAEESIQVGLCDGFYEL
jgi:ATP-dependent protease ClpP protease subunit